MKFYLLSIYSIIENLELFLIEKYEFIIDFTLLFFFKINFYRNNTKPLSNAYSMLFNSNLSQPILSS